MPKALAPPRRRLRLAPVPITIGFVAVLAVAYCALIAVVMSYAASTIAFAQSVRDDEASVAVLESNYLAQVAAITDTNYVAAGYEKPASVVFVPAAGVTALR